MKILIFIKQRSAAQIIMSDFQNAFESFGHTTKYIDLKEFLNSYNSVESNKLKQDILGKFIKELVEFDADFAITYGREIFEIAFPDYNTGQNIYLGQYLNIPVILLFFDDPLCAPYGKRGLEPSELIKSPVCYSYCWDKKHLSELHQKGYKNSKYLPLGINCKRFYYDESLEEFHYLNKYITFVGGPSKERLDVINSLKSDNAKIFGYQKEEWLKSLNNEKFYQFPVNESKKLCNIYSNSLINLNITREHGKDSANMRIFEILACRGFLITDYKEVLEDLFEINKELIIYKTVEELNEKIEYYSNNPEQRKKIIKNGYSAIIQKHQYSVRTSEILKDCKMFLPLSKKYIDAVTLFYNEKYNESITKCMSIIEETKIPKSYIQESYVYYLIAMNYNKKGNKIAHEEFLNLASK